MIGFEGRRALSPELKEVDARLRDWGDWAGKGKLNIGWPSTSISGRMVEWHRIGIRPDPGSPPSIEIPPLIATLDRLIAKLPEKQRKVVVVHYTRDDPFEIKCRMARSPGGTYRRLLDNARWSLRFGLNL